MKRRQYRGKRDNFRNFKYRFLLRSIFNLPEPWCGFEPVVGIKPAKGRHFKPSEAVNDHMSAPFRKVSWGSHP